MSGLVTALHGAHIPLTLGIAALDWLEYEFLQLKSGILRRVS